MKKYVKSGNLIGIGIFLFLPALSGAFAVCEFIRFRCENAKHYEKVQRQMKMADPCALLSACRELMNDPRTYNEDFLIRHEKNAITNDVWMRGLHTQYKYSTNLPAIIRMMSPVHVAVSEDEVYALVHLPPRMGFIACREGLTPLKWEGDRTMITNGLWYFRDQH